MPLRILLALAATVVIGTMLLTGAGADRGEQAVSPNAAATSAEVGSDVPDYRLGVVADTVDDDPPAPEPPDPEPPDPELVAAIGRIVDRPDLAISGRVGVVVLDATGHEVFAHGADAPLLPASTQKILTAGAALMRHGPGHNFVTRVFAGRPMDTGGTVPGDLILVGGGDPALVTDEYHRWIYPSRPWTSLDALADRLVARGLRHVLGGVVGDSSLFAGRTTATGWKSEYLQDLNARHVTGLTVEAGLDWWVEEPPPDVQLEIHLAADPVLEAATRLQDLLRSRGVTFLWGPSVAEKPTDVTVDLLGAARSPDLGDLARHTLERSDNHLADMLFVGLGAEGERVATWPRATTAVTRTFADAGVDTTGMVVDDGSGLSRHNRVSARQLAAIDAVLTGSEHGDAWRDALATAGREGTLRGRLRGTLAEGRFHGKTGTLDDVRAVVGHVTGLDGRRYHLAVVANDLTGGERWKASVLADELTLALVAHLDGCELVTANPRPSESGAEADTGPPTEPYRSDTVC